MLNILAAIRGQIKLTLVPILYKHYPIGLRPRRFGTWLNCLRETQGLFGAVLEVGVASGGTAAFSHKYLREGGDQRPYVCVDTFNGFVKEQFAEDVKLGNSWAHFATFSASSKQLVRKVLDLHGGADVILIQGDISKLTTKDIPSSISACLLDVDLAVPIYDGLRLIWPLLEAGGFICVDDCYEEDTGNWQALKGLQRFCQENGLQPVMKDRLGILQRPISAEQAAVVA